MKKRFYSSTLLSFIFLLALANAASAQSQTFVSAKSGDDINPCTLELPCRSFNQAISVVQARGEVVALSSGDYAPFTVDKSVSVYAAPGVHASVIATATGTAVTVSPPASTDRVTLRDLRINGLTGNTTGIRLLTGKLSVEGCVVENMWIGIIVEGAGRLYVADTVIRSCSHAVDLVSSIPGKATLERCRLEKNFITGVLVTNASQVTIRGSVLSGNSSAVRVVENGDPKAEVTLEDCLVTDNVTGIHAELAGALVRVSNTTVVGNGTGLNAVNAGAIISRRNNTVEGNTNNGTFTGNFLAK